VKEKIEEWIERYKYYVGAVLLLLILVGGGILLWRDNIYKPGLESRIMNQELRIEELTKELEDIKNASVATTSEALAPVASDDTAGEVAGTSTNSSSSSAKVTGKINLNTATASQLDSLPGIGPVYAQRIVDYRIANGPFISPEQVQNIKGIGPKTYEKFKDMITI
jgi:competence protein ComEA